MDIAFAGSKGIHIGYCPQQDALDDFLTGWEHLYYFCNLRGISKQHMHKVSLALNLDYMVAVILGPNCSCPMQHQALWILP